LHITDSKQIQGKLAKPTILFPRNRSYKEHYKLTVQGEIFENWRERMLIDHEKLRAVVRAIVAAAGSIGEEPRLVADEIVVDNGPIIVVDGHAGYGQVIGGEAMTIGIERARQHGVCVMAIRRSYHLCRIGVWGEQCARAGMISMHHVNAVGLPGIVAPFRGKDGRFSTNPYCCVIPDTENNPMTVLDMATTVMAHGKVRIAKNKGERLREGVLLDDHGRPTTDPNDLFGEPRGALLPAGEHKGYALALINELLAGVLSGGGTCRPETNRPNDSMLNNTLSIIIDPRRLVDSAFFESEIDATIAQVKASPPMNPDEPVLVPGDPERAMLAERKAEGIPIDDETWQEILAAAESVGLRRERIEEMAV
jgi:uncharacterized oxidoreductase